MIKCEIFILKLFKKFCNGLFISLFKIKCKKNNLNNILIDSKINIINNINNIFLIVHEIV